MSAITPDPYLVTTQFLVAGDDAGAVVRRVNDVIEMVLSGVVISTEAIVAENPEEARDEES